MLALALLVALAVAGCVAEGGAGGAGGEGTTADADCLGPQNVQATALSTSNLVTWDEMSFARAYEVFRATGDGAFEQIGVTSGDHPETEGADHETSFLDGNVTPGETYVYKVRALLPPPDVSDFCGSATVTAIPDLPTPLAAVAAVAAGLGAFVVLRRR